MRPCFHVEIETPKKVLLNGLWFGPKKPKQAIVWVHGLTSTMFSKLSIIDQLVDVDTAVLVFNNRGHDKVTRIAKSNGSRMMGGAAHEKFTDSPDDIDGAIRLAKKFGAKRIYLAGHSTGCQKSAYWAYKRRSGVAGIILLAPISDYAATVMLDGKHAISRGMRAAKTLVKRGRPHELLPTSAWSWGLLADAQRFISLYSGEGAEEIFTYWDKKRNPKTLRSIRIPILVLLAEHDEYADRAASEMADWFLDHIYTGEALIVPGTNHGFKRREKLVAREIKDWMARV